MAHQEAEMLKEFKRQERARKLKQKINGYHEQIKSEAQELQDLQDLGINVESLL